MTNKLSSEEIAELNEDLQCSCKEADQLRGNLSLAEEGLANYALEVAALRKQVDYEDAAHTKTVEERDRVEAYADQLADMIGVLCEVEIGEHSSGNFPWENAIEAMRDAIGSKQTESEPRSDASFPNGTLPDARLIRSALFQQFLRQEFWHAHHVDLMWRYDGKDIREEADWLKDLWYAIRGSEVASPPLLPIDPKAEAVVDGLVAQRIAAASARPLRAFDPDTIPECRCGVQHWPACPLASDWPDCQVRCECGWTGKAKELKRPNSNDTRYRCPKCSTEFRSYPLQHVNTAKSEASAAKCDWPLTHPPGCRCAERQGGSQWHLNPPV